ncbi:hypothetical protein [Natrinema marinum]|uniref:hypothetical protein n=1 Tax=Natrinema marinum TaxID=2961598 RepID=UPI0020C84959|nr:hypothetical protein [Natrinema marinum]
MAQERVARVLLFTYDYEAGATFDVISQLEAGTTVALLRTTDGETVPEIPQPDEYTGYVVRNRSDNGPLEPTTVLFVRDRTFSADDSETLSEDASMFSSRLNLFETSLE